MGKVLWHITMSLDGFIAGPGGDMSWMAGYGGANPTAEEVMSKIGALFIGHRTFLGDDDAGAGSEEGKPYGGVWQGPMFVLTHDKAPAPTPGFTFVGDLESGIAAAKAAAGDGYVVVLGANTAQQCLDAGVLDEILIHVVPVLLGDGVRLFDRKGGDLVRLERLSLTHSPQVTNIWLSVVRAP
ncbi:deaminase [Rhizocola hellebori]|uniref:Deaminase n=1 Tax=Rhizocola hellebori TaxID=1392758 RepID=A0A8J3QDF7_9ACTN|nr:dihydrofolate reductase family protein [Rhizocola hellebori]GIH08012.1 deaminase [Rhizocola hellebori]